MKLPVIIVNFKTYPGAVGEGALNLAKIHEKVARETGVNIAVAVQAVDLRMIASEVDIPVLAQHFDYAEEGPYTGHLTAHALKSAGVYGSLLNHSEKRILFDDIEESIDLAKRLGLFTVLCAESQYEGDALMRLDPDMVAVEPPELIGGEVSVCDANPQLVRDAVKMVGEGKLLVGAGVKNRHDVAAAINYGASGVLVSSGVTRSPDPEKSLYDLVQGFNGAVAEGV